jgi:hypothetical protein
LKSFQLLVGGRSDDWANASSYTQQESEDTDASGP